MGVITFHFRSHLITMEYNRQHHIQQEPDHLNIHWDTLTICQLNCSYCYARNEYGDKWGKLASKPVIDAVIKALSKSTLSFNLGMLGGEPTLSPYYTYIIEEIQKLKNSLNLYVTTNGYKDLTSHPVYDNFAFLFSYHPADCVDKSLFTRNVKSSYNRGIQTKVNVMLHHDERLWPDIKQTIDTFLSMGIKVHPHFLYTHSSRKLFKYKPEFWEFFNFLEDLDKELVYDNDHFNDYQIYKNGMTSFTGWSCYNNNYEVDVYGNVVQFCRDRKEHVNLTRDTDFFKRITHTKPMTCLHSACNCDGLLKQLKVNTHVITLQQT